MSLFCVPLTLFGFCESPPVKDSNVLQFESARQNRNKKKERKKRSRSKKNQCHNSVDKQTESHICTPQLCCPSPYNEWYCSDKCNPLGEYSASVFFQPSDDIYSLYGKMNTIRTFGEEINVTQFHISIEHQLIPMNIRLSVSNSNSLLK